MSLDFLFQPSSIALVGITTANPDHWTRTFLNSLIEFGFDGQLYLVNPKGGEINGYPVYPSIQDIPGSIDYAISLAPAAMGPSLVEESAKKGVLAIHFCTAGFSELGNKEGARLERDLSEIARKTCVRIVGPNCMGIYCPRSRMSFSPSFSKESGSVGFISQSGGNAIHLVRQATTRGIRFSKVVSYGNACDLNESDFLEYLADDADTEIITLYIEGIKDGRRFRQALEQACQKKRVILLKAGVSHGGTRAAASHTSSLSGNDSVWDALCKQTGAIRVSSLIEMVDVLVTLQFLSAPRGKKTLLIGGGGGASVLITDEFEKHGFEIPQLPQELIAKIREFTPEAGNIFHNPVDYSQAIMYPDKLNRTIDIVSRWEGIDLLVMFIRTGQWAQQTDAIGHPSLVLSGFLNEAIPITKPVAIVLEPSVLPQESKGIYNALQDCAAARLPVYYTFAGAANAINLVMSDNRGQPDITGR
ncbi:acetate--CoA ligase family protein [Chloroflexota bacterium]